MKYKQTGTYLDTCFGSEEAKQWVKAIDEFLEKQEVNNEQQ